MNRRDFLKKTAGAAVALGVLGTTTRANSAPKLGSKPKRSNAAQPGKAELKKAILLSMLPDSMPLPDRMKLAKDCGFEAVEVPFISDPNQIKDISDASSKSGVAVHSIMFGGWQTPLSSPDPEVAKRGADDLSTALKSAKELGADGVLLVPAVVNGDTRYIEAYERSQKYLKQLAPLAEKYRVRILVENVWNNFLLSPIEFARYVDEIKSPWVQAYFDVGNVVAFGWSEDWIRTLGPRIKKIHLKDFKRGPRQFCNLLDGDVNWSEVRKALDEVGYQGYLTPELGGGDEAYLRDVSARVDKIISQQA